MAKQLIQIPIVCCECGKYLGAYVRASGEPTLGPAVLRFCSGVCDPPASFDEEERRETARQRAIALRLAC